MEYKGYLIKHQPGGYYLVIGPNGETWTEDTVAEAKQAIDFLEEGK